MSDLTDLRKRAQQQAQTGNYWAGKVVGLIDKVAELEDTLGGAPEQVDVYHDARCDRDGSPASCWHPMNWVDSDGEKCRQLDYGDLVPVYRLNRRQLPDPTTGTER